MEFDLREFVSLNVGRDYHVFWKKDQEWVHYFTAELVELYSSNVMPEFLDGERVVDTAAFGNGRTLDLTHPALRLLEVERG